MAKKPEKDQEVRREATEDDTIEVGAGNIDREPLPDDAYLDGVIRKLEIRENCPGFQGGDPVDKLAIAVELIDFPDEHDEDGGNRLAFVAAKLSMHPKANLHKWVKSILGVDLKNGVKFRPMSLLNVPCRVLMKSWENDDGTTGQCISDFKPYKGKLKKGMKNPAEAAEEMEASSSGGSKGGSKKKTTKKTSSKKAAPANDDGGWDEDVAAEIASFLREGGKELVDAIASECGITKKAIQGCIKNNDDFDEVVYNLLVLLSTNKHDDSRFEKLSSALDAWNEGHDLDADEYSEWATYACHLLALNGVSEMPTTAKDLSALIKEGPGEAGGEEEEEEDEEEEEGGDGEWSVGDRCVVDYDGEPWAGEITAIEDDEATVKFDDDGSEDTVGLDALSAEEEGEDEDGEEGGDDEEEEEEDGDDDDDLGFLD